nr:hypothetical protein HK105_004008 [Polyrhizophydium stewartii]
MLDKVQFSFPDELQCVTVASNMLAVALRTFTAPKEQTRLRLLRIDLDKPDAIEDIVFVTKQRDDAIQAVFYSPLAHHLIISCYSGDNYYLHERWNKPHLLSKIRGVRITSVAWGPGESAETTGPLLLGSAQGHVFETELNPREDFFKKEERYFAQVFSLHRDAPIVGIHVEQLSRGNSRFLIAIASTSRIYQFVGDSRPSDSGFFASFFARLDGSNDFQEMPGNLGASTVRTIRTKQPDGSLVTALGWMTGTGVYIGKIATGGYTHKDATIESPQVFPYAAPDSRSQSSLVNSLVSFILSDFHFVLLLEDSIVAISTLDSQIVAWESIPLAMDERVLGMASDESRRTYWVHTNLSLYELIVTDEDRDLWKIYLDKKNYELASEYAKTPEQRGIVKEKQADHLFAQKQYAAAAGLYAETDLSFEDLIYFAELISDWDRLVTFFIEHHEWHKALEVISRQDSVDFYYKHSSVLIQHIPREVIGLWMKAALIGYLEYLVSSGNRDRVIQNFLMQLYAADSTPDNETPVLAFVNSQRGLMQSAVQLYAIMGLFDEAVDLALKVDFLATMRRLDLVLTATRQNNDLDLARIVANKPDEHDDERKKLWLRIAQHVISNSTSVNSALEYLKVGNLKIEEILPFFPDFVLIDDFKEELCNALEDYNAYISALKTDLDEATKASESIRLDIRELKNRKVLHLKAQIEQEVKDHASALVSANKARLKVGPASRMLIECDSLTT